jgi:hypothetical protein
MIEDFNYTYYQVENYLKTSDLRNKEDAKHFPSDLILIFEICRACVRKGKPASLSNKNYNLPKSSLLEKKQKSALLRGTAVYSGAGATFIKPSTLRHARAKPSQNFPEENKSQPC